MPGKAELRHLLFVGCGALLAICGANAFALQDDSSSSRAAVKQGEADVAAKPDDATLHYYLAIRKHAAGDLQGSISSLENVLRLGSGFMPVTDEFFSGLKSNSSYLALVEKFESDLPRTIDAPVYHRFGDRALLPEGVAWDPVTRTTFVGGVKGAITALQDRGAEQRFVHVSQWPLVGIAIIPASRLLCAVSSNAMLDAGQSDPHNSISCFDIRSRKRRHFYQLTEATGLNDLAIDGVNKLIYASDTLQGTIWKISLRDNTTTKLLPEGSIPSVNGIALSCDGKTIFAAHRTGIARIETATSAFELNLKNHTLEHVSAIDGLYLIGNNLVGIQSITTPGRVISIRLKSDGSSITDVVTIQSHHHPDFDQPTTGALVDGVIRVLATTQISRLQPDGSISSPEGLKRPTLIDVPLPSLNLPRTCET